MNQYSPSVVFQYYSTSYCVIQLGYPTYIHFALEESALLHRLIILCVFILGAKLLSSY